MAAWNMTIQMLLVVAFGALAAESLRSGIKKNDKILNLLDLELLDKEVDDDKMNPEEMEKISRKVDSMSDEELASVLYAVMPHERPKRTIGTFRRCLEKVRCLFRNIGQKRSRRNSPAAVIRTISKLTSIASDAANEILGKRLGSSLNLSNLFRPAKSPSSSLVLPSDEAESAASSLSSSAAADEAEDELETDGSEVVEQQTCDQRCNLSILVYRRLRRLLRRL